MREAVDKLSEKFFLIERIICMALKYFCIRNSINTFYNRYALHYDRKRDDNRCPEKRAD